MQREENEKRFFNVYGFVSAETIVRGGRRKIYRQDLEKGTPPTSRAESLQSVTGSAVVISKFCATHKSIAPDAIEARGCLSVSLSRGEKEKREVEARSCVNHILTKRLLASQHTRKVGWLLCLFATQTRSSLSLNTDARVEDLGARRLFQFACLSGLILLAFYDSHSHDVCETSLREEKLVDFLSSFRRFSPESVRDFRSTADSDWLTDWLTDNRKQSSAQDSTSERRPRLHCSAWNFFFSPRDSFHNLTEVFSASKLASLMFHM